MQVHKINYRNYFTLVELLVVIAILTLLISMVAPALERTIYNGKKVQCLNNLKQQTAGVMMYTDDFNDLYPAPPTGYRNSNHYGGRLMIMRNYFNGDIRQIRPYWGWDGKETVNNWGTLYPAKTDIEICTLRARPLIDKFDPMTHYYYQFSTNDSSKMLRPGDVRAINTNGQIYGTTVLINDVFSDRQSRITNHTELDSRFIEAGTPTNGDGHHGRPWVLPSSVKDLPPISGNFAGQDGSVREFVLPTGYKGAWLSYPGFTRKGWCAYFPDEFVEKL
jgi:hypothetical protein